MGDDKDENKLDIDTKKATCITLIAKSLFQNGLGYMKDLEATPVELVSGIHKATAYGCYLTL